MKNVSRGDAKCAKKAHANRSAADGSTVVLSSVYPEKPALSLILPRARFTLSLRRTELEFTLSLPKGRVEGDGILPGLEIILRALASYEFDPKSRGT